MTAEKRTTVLVVGGQTEALERALGAAGFLVLGSVDSESDLDAAVRAHAPDAIVIHADSPARDTLEHVALLNRRTPKPVVMLCAGGDRALLRAAAQAGVSLYAVDGLTPALLHSLVEVAVLHFRSRASLLAELEQTRQSLDEGRTIDRAKCLLMEREALSEADAYHWLRRAAMQRGQRLADVARVLLEKALA
jgi:response regulator NasT